MLGIWKFSLHAPREYRRRDRIAQLALRAEPEPEHLRAGRIHRQVALHDVECLRCIAAIECDIAQLQQTLGVVRAHCERAIEKFLRSHQVAGAARARTRVAQCHPRRLIQRIDRDFLE